MNSLQYRPEIDGLRALAILFVLFFHQGHLWAKNGYLGVDVFLVISGYLITTIITKELNQSKFNLKHFWMRRVSRIYPGLIGMILGVLIIAIFFLYYEYQKQIATTALFSMTSLSNAYFWKNGLEYWNSESSQNPLLHTWSLSLEIQFYFCFSLLTYGLYKYAREYFSYIVAFVSLCSFIFEVIFRNSHQNSIFYLIPFRFWEFGGGCITALAADQFKNTYKKLQSNIVPAVGLILITISFFYVSSEIIILKLLAVMGTSIFIFFTNKNSSFICNFISNTSFVFLGKISYSLYLWHWPLWVILSQMILNNFFVLSLSHLIVSIIAAVLSFYFIEKKAGFKWSAIILILISTICMIIFKYPIEYPINMFEKVVWNGKKYNVGVMDQWNDSIKIMMSGAEIEERNQKDNNSYSKGGIIRNYGNLKPDIVVLGDSHALMWSGIIDHIACAEKRSISFYAAEGTDPFIENPPKIRKANSFFTEDQLHEYDIQRLHFLKEWNPELIFFSIRWSNFSDINEMLPLFNFIQSLNSKVVLIEQPPIILIGDTLSARYFSYLNILPKEQVKQYKKFPYNSSYEKGKLILNELLKKYPKFSIIRTSDIFFNQNNETWILDGKNILYFDDDHLSEYGAKQLEPRLKNSFTSAFQPSSMK